jgi:DNA-binding transcriptional LysR family regulator
MRGWDGFDEFMAVAEQLSFAKAAAQLRLSPAHVSRQIARLEDRLQTRLFYRTTRRVSLTSAGEILLDGGKQLEREKERVLDSVVDAGSLPIGPLRMVAPREYGEHMVAPLLAEFALANPAVQVELELMDLPIDISVANWDLAIMIGPISDSALIAIKVAPCRMHLCASPAYLDRRGIPVLPQDLADHACLMGTASSWLLKDKAVRPTPHWRCNSGMVVRQAALRGLGIAYLSDYVVQDDLARGDLVSLLDAHLPEDRGLWAAYPYHRLRSRKVQMALDMLRAGLSTAKPSLAAALTP